MGGYTLRLVVKGLADKWRLTLMMIASISVGIAILMVMLTMSYQKSRMPMADKSTNIHLVQIDSREAEADPEVYATRMVDLTYQDSKNLFGTQSPAVDEAMLYKASFVINTAQESVHPISASAVATVNNFFSMFDVPFIYGGPWSEEVDRDGNPVVVLTTRMNNHFFAGEDSVGKQVQLEGISATVVGVIGEWTIANRFYDRSFTRDRFDDAFVPMQFAVTNNMGLAGRGRCWPSDRGRQAGFQSYDINGLLASECTWVTYWIEVDNTNQFEAYKDFLNQYVSDQKSIGRIPRERQIWVTPIRQLMRERGNGLVTPFAIMAYAGFIVCLLNSIGILLAKYLSKSKEISLRRALGAKRKMIMLQHLVEVSIIGVVSGVIGLLLAIVGLYGMKHNYLYQKDYTVALQDIEKFYQVDWTMALSAIGIAVVSTIIVGLYPISSLCNIAPGSQLKSQ